MPYINGQFHQFQPLTPVWGQLEYYDDHVLLLMLSMFFLSCSADSVFELTSVCLNVAIWYTKYAAKLAAKGE